jgi:hypothetical protein
MLTGWRCPGTLQRIGLNAPKAKRAKAAKPTLEQRKAQAEKRAQDLANKSTRALTLSMKWRRKAERLARLIVRREREIVIQSRSGKSVTRNRAIELGE